MPASVRAFYQDYTCADLSVTDWGLGWLPRRQPVAAIREYAAYLKAHPEALGSAGGPPSSTGESGSGGPSAASSAAPSSQRPGASGRDS